MAPGGCALAAGCGMAHLSLRGLALEGLKLLHLAVPRVEVAEEDAPLRRRTVDEAVPGSI